MTTFSVARARATKRLLPAAVLLGFVCDAAAQVPAGGEFVVNTHTAERQRWPGLAVEPDGDFVATWMGWHQDGSLTGIFGQRYARDGTRRGGEFQVNTFTPGYQNWYGTTSVAANARGEFVVVWASRDQDGDGWGVFARRYNSAGAPLGPEFQVNTTTAGDQGGVHFAYQSIAVDMNAVGRFIVAWGSDQDGSGSEIYARCFDQRGWTVRGEFRVNTATLGYQATPAVAMDTIGRVVVAWSTPDGDGSGIAARRFNGGCNPVGEEFLVNSHTTGDQGREVFAAPGLALSDDGAFVVAWEDYSGHDGDGLGVFARRFDAADNPLGPEFAVNTYTTGLQGVPSLSADEAGNFVITWVGDDGSGYGNFGQRFLADGSRRGGEFLINADTAGAQTTPAVGLDAAGNFAVAWDGLDGSLRGILGRRFGGLFPAGMRVDTAGNGVLEPGETAGVLPAWENGTGAAQAFATTLSSPSGPPGGVPSIVDGAGAYGVIADGDTGECTDCLVVAVPAASPRPTVHWDATVLETVAPDVQGQAMRWRLHVGASFADVPPASPFYRFIETLLHRQVTGGCSGAQYCPAGATTRGQMAVFVLMAKEGPGYSPPACGTAPMFADVPPSITCPYVEELARRGVVSGCGGGNYCPNAPVSREQMAVFVLRTLEATLVPPACGTPMFGDVPAASPFCRWVEELARRNVVAGCGGGNYCPALPVTREQMSVFLGVTFGLTLYGP